MTRALLLLGLVVGLAGCHRGGTADLPAALETHLMGEGITRRAADLTFRYTEGAGRANARWEDRIASIVVTPGTILIHKQSKIGLEITSRTRRDIAIERDGTRIRIRAGRGRAALVWSFEPPDGDIGGWTRDLRTVMRVPADSAAPRGAKRRADGS